MNIESQKRSHDNLQIQDDRRAYERYPSKLKARLFFGNLIYTGMVTDLSLKGMFITTKVGFPVNSEFIMVVLLNDSTVKIPVKVRRRVSREDNLFTRTRGIGVELLDAPHNYTEYVGNYRFAENTSH